MSYNAGEQASTTRTSAAPADNREAAWAGRGDTPGRGKASKRKFVDTPRGSEV